MIEMKKEEQWIKENFGELKFNLKKEQEELFHYIAHKLDGSSVFEVPYLEVVSEYLNYNIVNAAYAYMMYLTTDSLIQKYNIGGVNEENKDIANKVLDKVVKATVHDDDYAWMELEEMILPLFKDDEFVKFYAENIYSVRGCLWHIHYINPVIKDTADEVDRIGLLLEDIVHYVGEEKNIKMTEKEERAGAAYWCNEIIGLPILFTESNWLMFSPVLFLAATHDVKDGKIGTIMEYSTPTMLEELQDCIARTYQQLDGILDIKNPPLALQEKLEQIKKIYQVNSLEQGYNR